MARSKKSSSVQVDTPSAVAIDKPKILGIREESKQVIRQTTLAKIFIATPANRSFWAQQEKRVVWTELLYGNCQMRDGSTLLFREDGTFIFDAVVRSSGTNDTWEHRFEVYDATNVFLFRLPYPLPPQFHYNFQMKQSHTWYSWHFEDKFPKEQFAKIGQATAIYFC